MPDPVFPSFKTTCRMDIDGNPLGAFKVGDGDATGDWVEISSDGKEVVIEAHYELDALVNKMTVGPDGSVKITQLLGLHSTYDAKPTQDHERASFVHILEVTQSRVAGDPTLAGKLASIVGRFKKTR